jgi:glycosyltransferase involved in cell wall biosynthesis
MESTRQPTADAAPQPRATPAPLVSVVIPVYNGVRTLRAALDSVLAQTFTDYEIIVVDDASTDASASIVRAYGNRIHFIQRPVNSGICEVARSQGLAAARGRYAALLDQDDLWEPRKLEHQVAFMEAHPRILLSHTYAWVIDTDGRRQGVRHDGRIPPTGPCAHELLEHSFITISTILVRGRTWLEAGNAARLTSANSDLPYFFSILKQSPEGFGFIPEPLGSYRQWPGGMSRNRWKWTPKDVPALVNLSNSGLWRGLASRRQMRSSIAAACRINAGHHYHQAAFAYAAYFALLGWRYRPGDLRLPGWLARTALKSILHRLARPFQPRPADGKP